MSNFVAIQNTAMPVVEYHGKRVVTFSMIDKAPARKKGTAKRTFNRNRPRFIEGEDFFEIGWGLKDPNLTGGAFSEFAPRGIVLTESGYLMLVKPFGDDLSWDVQRQMVKAYFRRNTLGELRHVELPSLEELSQMSPEKAQHIVAKAEKYSSYGHGKPNSAAMTLRRRELKQIRPATQILINLHQLSLCDLGDFSKGGPHA